MGKEELGERIRVARKSRNITQAQLAETLGVGSSTIGMWENGQREPDLDTIEALADVFNVPISYLVSGGDDMKAPGSVSKSDYAALEALHQNPRLRLLFDRQLKMSPGDIELMLKLSERMNKEMDGID